MMNEAKIEDQLLLDLTSNMVLSVLSKSSNRSIFLLEELSITISLTLKPFPETKLIFVPQKLVNIRQNIITAYLSTGNFRKFQYDI